MKVRLPKSPKIVAIHKRIRRAVGRISRPIERTIRRAGRQIEKEQARELTTKSIQRRVDILSGALSGAAVGGPIGAVVGGIAAATKGVLESKAEAKQKKALGQEALVQAAEDKKLSDAGIGTEKILTPPRDKKKKGRRLRGSLQLISTTPRGILGEPTIGRRRLTAF